MYRIALLTEKKFWKRNAIKAQQILKALFRNATYAIAEVAEVALCASNCALPTSENVQQISKMNWRHKGTVIKCKMEQPGRANKFSTKRVEPSDNHNLKSLQVSSIVVSSTSK